MMDAGLGSRLNDKYPAPKCGRYTLVGRDGGTPLGSRRLDGSSVEESWWDDANGLISAHRNSFVMLIDRVTVWKRQVGERAALAIGRDLGVTVIGAAKSQKLPHTGTIKVLLR
jgi:hypothetical protein